MCRPLGAGLSIGGLAILALVTLAPPVPAQAADALYDPFDRCAFYAGDPDYPEVSARNPKPVAGYLGDLSRVYGRPFDFIEVAPAIEHCEAAVAYPDAQPRHGYFLARACLRHGAVDKAFPLLIETARQGEPGSVALMLDNVNNPHMKIDRAGELFPLAAKMIAPGGVTRASSRYGYIFYRALDVPAVVKAPGAYRNARAMAEKFGEGGTPYLYFRRHPRSPRFTPEKGEAAAFRQRYRFLTANARADFPQIYDQLALSLLRYDAAKQGGVSLADFMAGEDVNLLGEDLQTTITERLARLGDRRRRKDLYQWAVRRRRRPRHHGETRRGVLLQLHGKFQIPPPADDGRGRLGGLSALQGAGADGFENLFGADPMPLLPDARGGPVFPRRLRRFAGEKTPLLPGHRRRRAMTRAVSPPGAAPCRLTAGPSRG